MSRTPSPLAAVFDAYGDDAAAGLQALANTDPPFWSQYVDAAAEKQYRSDYSKHRRTMAVSIERERVADKGGQVRLFDPGESLQRIRLRETLVLDGDEFDLASLTGTDGAAVIRKVAERDLRPATTTVERCRAYFQLADHVEAESFRLGRDVSVGEVLGRAA